MDPETTTRVEPGSVPDTGLSREPDARVVLPRGGDGNLRPLYVSPRGLTRGVAAGFVASTLATWLALGVHLAHLRQLHITLSGTDGNAQQLALITTTLRIAEGIQIFAYCVTAVLFLVWLHRLRVNVRALGMRKLAHARRWAVLGFLIPGLNIVRPYQVLAEVWRASDPSVLDPFEWKGVEPPRLLTLWWTTFVMAAALELAAFGLGLTAGVPAFESVVASTVAILANATAAVSASLAYFVVNQLAAAQMAKRERLRREAPDA